MVKTRASSEGVPSSDKPEYSSSKHPLDDYLSDEKGSNEGDKQQTPRKPGRPTRGRPRGRRSTGRGAGGRSGSRRYAGAPGLTGELKATAMNDPVPSIEADPELSQYQEPRHELAAANKPGSTPITEASSTMFNNISLNSHVGPGLDSLSTSSSRNHRDLNLHFGENLQQVGIEGNLQSISQPFGNLEANGPMSFAISPIGLNNSTVMTQRNSVGPTPAPSPRHDFRREKHRHSNTAKETDLVANRYLNAIRGASSGFQNNVALIAGLHADPDFNAISNNFDFGHLDDFLGQGSVDPNAMTDFDIIGNNINFGQSFSASPQPDFFPMNNPGAMFGHVQRGIPGLGQNMNVIQHSLGFHFGDHANRLGGSLGLGNADLGFGPESMILDSHDGDSKTEQKNEVSYDGEQTGSGGLDQPVSVTNNTPQPQTPFQDSPLAAVPGNKGTGVVVAPSAPNRWQPSRPQSPLILPNGTTFNVNRHLVNIMAAMHETLDDPCNPVYATVREGEDLTPQQRFEREQIMTKMWQVHCAGEIARMGLGGDGVVFVISRRFLLRVAVGSALWVASWKPTADGGYGWVQRDGNLFDTSGERIIDMQAIHTEHEVAQSVHKKNQEDNKDDDIPADQRFHPTQLQQPPQQQRVQSPHMVQQEKPMNLHDTDGDIEYDVFVDPSLQD
ncbi:hypothetical protein BX600DRAFT_430521 [Xylariales sp. PMI_506]|nr:hypothetical protein BX600DRAFT_430521 [Xylariales sp. PMI_506]